MQYRTGFVLNAKCRMLKMPWEAFDLKIYVNRGLGQGNSLRFVRLYGVNF